MDPCSCYAILTDPERKKLYAGIFPEDKIPITPVEGKGKTSSGNPFDFWLVDVARTTPEQREKIFDAVSKKFNIPKEAVLKDAARGIPVSKEGAEFHFCPNHLRWGNDVFSMRNFM